MIRSVSVKSAIKDALEVFQFDQWIRFYYVVEKEKELWIEIPEAVLEGLKKDYPHLHPYADMVNELVTDYQRSQENVCSFIASRLDGQKYEQTVLPQVFDSSTFKVEMYIFNVWLKMHESHLDEEPMTFTEWLDMYEGWNSLDEVQEYRTKLQDSGTDPGMPTCSTKQ
ncbi:conserved protein of unknown function [Pseudodesulfovibrio profundus]|uniref:Uncharacterized protein n=1 Tax=Pseudodesulfovibrio profundus TaxID=57320 RepID=A0A2C8FB72_9BACT|nr:hypothetical protein [Pseudodesulfovibrio profundus]MBC15726.1 hypothetical protein [Desulfovibrio sp.]SOB59687.1 conserved protein of unknown function [Pseudodesulfovibrio profundus]|tara:strand:- start:29 stop:532 length:504 start_codon:yes stop_codon:yes gene_type:complete